MFNYNAYLYRIIKNSHLFILSVVELNQHQICGVSHYMLQGLLQRRYNILCTLMNIRTFVDIHEHLNICGYWWASQHLWTLMNIRKFVDINIWTELIFLSLFLLKLALLDGCFSEKGMHCIYSHLLHMHVLAKHIWFHK